MDHRKGLELLFGFVISERKGFAAKPMCSNQGECKDMHHQIIYGLCGGYIDWMDTGSSRNAA